MPPSFVPGKTQEGHTLDRPPGHGAAGRQLSCKRVTGLQCQPACHTAAGPWRKAPRKLEFHHHPAIQKEINTDE